MGEAFRSYAMGFAVTLVAAVVVSNGFSATASAADAPAKSGKEKIIFVINTMEDDVLGGVSVAYMDEYRWMKRWEKLYPGVKIIRIRANTNRGVTMALENWMRPNPETKEIVALDIHSHGAPMMLLDENVGFMVNLPNDLAKTFAPVIGHFAEDARIVFGGCEILAEQNKTQAMQSLKTIADTFKLKSGFVYANETVGAEGVNAFLVDVWNKDIPWQQRKTTLKVYLAWFMTLPAFAYQDRFNSNQGYLLQTRENEIAGFGRWRYRQNFDLLQDQAEAYAKVSGR